MARPRQRPASRLSTTVSPQTAGAQRVNILARADSAEEVLQAVTGTDGVVSAEIMTDSNNAQVVSGGQVFITATTEDPSEEIDAKKTVGEIRENLEGTGALVGGDAAVRLDTQETGISDLLKVVPVVLIVLVATFAVIMVILLLFMVQLAMIVAVGILIDTFVVRTLLIPGIVHDIGNRVWWPWQAKMIRADTDTERDEEKVMATEKSVSS